MNWCISRNLGKQYNDIVTNWINKTFNNNDKYRMGS